MLRKTRFILAGMLVLSACGGKEAAHSGGDGPDSSPDTTEKVAGEAAAEIDSWGRDPVSAAFTAEAIAVVKEVRAAEQERFDRFVVEFEDEILPEYHVAYAAEQPAQCGSGSEMNVAGEAIIELRLEPARGFTEEGHATLDHGPRVYSLPVIREARISCDYEAVFTILLGVDSRAEFRVSGLTNPARLVVDVRHSEN